MIFIENVRDRPIEQNTAPQMKSLESTETCVILSSIIMEDSSGNDRKFNARWEENATVLSDHFFKSQFLGAAVPNSFSGFLWNLPSIL